MAILHFIMTSPKWSLSLFLFLAARHNPIPTFNYAVEQPIERMKAAYIMESRSYQQCSLDAARMIQVELQLATQEEHERVSRIYEANLSTIENARRQKDKCFSAAKDGQSLLLQWQDEGNVVHLVKDQDTCSDDKRDDAEKLLGGEFKLLEEEVTSVWDQHFQQTLRGYQLIQQYAQARFQYDYDYFVGLRIEPALTLIASLGSIESLNLSVDDLVITERITSALLRLRETLRRAELALEALKDRVAELSKCLDAFHAAYVEIYDRLMKGAMFVQDMLPPGVPLPGFLNINGLAIADSMLPRFEDMDLFEVDFSSAYLLLDETVQICIDIIQEVVKELLAQSEHALRGAVSRISEALLSVLKLEDYDPPVFIGSQGRITTLSDEVAFQDNISHATMEQSRLLLARLNTIHMPKETPERSNITVETPMDSFSEESTSFAYLRPVFPSLFFPKILALIISVGSSFTWIMEVVIQAIRIWRLDVAYNKVSIPDLPEISYDTTCDEAEQPKTREVILGALLKFFATPRMLIGLILAPAIVAVIALWYPHVRSSCKETRDGTFLATRFLAPIFINEANALGNAYYLKAELQCHKTQQEICRQMQAQTLAQFQSVQSTFSELEQEYRMSAKVVETIKDCVTNDTMTRIEESCCDIKGFASCSMSSTPGFCPINYAKELPLAFHPLEEYLSEPACNETKWFAGLVEPTFQCEKLSKICEEIPCGGVDKVTLRAETVEADCQVELYALDFFFFVLWTIYHAATINLVSTLLFSGIRNVSWRKLCPEGIQFHTKMREDGSLAKGDDQQDRAERISFAIRRFELGGKLQICAGLGVTLIWVVTILI